MCLAAPPPIVVVAPVPAEKTHAVDFVNTPWKEVFAWLAKETKRIYISTETPNRMLTVKSDKPLTLPEVVDLLNDVLESKGWVIIQREHSFLMHPVGEKTPPELLLDELAKWGNTEVVQVVIPLKTLVAEDIAPQARKRLSKSGDLSAFGTSQLIVRDKGRNVRSIHKFVQERDNAEDARFTYTCQFDRAGLVAERLGTLLGDADTAVETVGRRNPVEGKRSATLRLIVDERTNAIVLTGPAHKLVAARLLVKDIDKGESP